MELISIFGNQANVMSDLVSKKVKKGNSDDGIREILSENPNFGGSASASFHPIQNHSEIIFAIIILFSYLCGHMEMKIWIGL